MPHPSVSITDDWGFWDQQPKSKKSKGKLLVNDQNESMKKLKSNTSPELLGKKVWPASIEPTWIFTSLQEASEQTKDGKGSENLEKIIKVLTEKINDIEFKCSSMSGRVPPPLQIPLIDPVQTTELPLPQKHKEPSPRTVSPGIHPALPKHLPEVNSISDVADFSTKGMAPPMCAPYTYQPLKPPQSYAVPMDKVDRMPDVVFDDDRRRSHPRAVPRYRSRSSSPSVFSDISSVASHGIERVNNHSDIIPCSETGEILGEDLVATIVPFHRKVYLSYHDFTSVDFKQYLGLLKYAKNDGWYPMPDQATLQSIKEIEVIARLQGAEPSAQKIQEAMSPVDYSPNGNSIDSRNSTQVSRINVGRALRIMEVEPDCSCKQKARSTCKALSCNKATCTCKKSHVPFPCEDCKMDKRLPRSEMSGLRYLSVVQAHQDNYNFNTGTPIYKVVQTGSRCAAAAQSFFDAGAHGWSTVFVCALPAQRSLASEVAKYGDVLVARHALSMDEALVHENYHGKEWMRVLY